MSYSDELLIRSVCGQYGEPFRPRWMEPTGDYEGFSGAMIVRLRCPAGTFCLRRWPTLSPPAERLLGLHRLLADVARQGVYQVAVPVPSADGSTLVQRAGCFWQIEPWMPGTADFWNNRRPSRLIAAVTCLAQWHSAATLFRPRGAEARWFAVRAEAASPAVRERLEQIDAWRSGRLDVLRRAIAVAPRDAFREMAESLLSGFAAVAPRIAFELRQAAELRVPLQPCLRDVWHDHVLFTGDDVTGLIDAAACRSESVAADLARLLGSLVEDDHEAWDTAIEAYHAARRLRLAERQLIPPLDHSAVLLSGLIWLDRIYLQRQSLARQDRVLERMARIRRRLDVLVQSASSARSRTW